MQLLKAEILRAFLWAFKANLWPVGYLEPWVLRTSFSLFYITLVTYTTSRI